MERTHAPVSPRGDAPQEASRPDAHRSPWFHLGLFALTALVVLAWWWPDLEGGGLYAAGLLSILLAHEMGHYVAAQRYGVDVTLPYFLPGLPPFYTFGAFIKMRAPRMEGEALLVIGAAGPLAGMVVALPVYMVGLGLSEVMAFPALAPPGSSLVFGDSLLSGGLGWLFFGALAPGQDVVLHPLAYAGWVGFFVTALNLVPIGQLDGGHIAYALFGERYVGVSRLLFGALVMCGAALHPVWLVLGIFLVLSGVTHPPITERAARPLPLWCQLIGYLCLGIFALTFVPVPIHLPPLWESAWMLITGGR